MFSGDPQFPGGVPQCEERCAKDGLKMAAYVYLGEYTSGCVCAPPKDTATQEQQTADDEASDPSAAFSGVTAAQAVAVVYQRRRQDSGATAVVLGALNVGLTLTYASRHDGQ
jgi:hypothetical protein